MSYLIKSKISELAYLTDELEINDSVIFSTEDPDVLKHYKLEPCKYNVIYKTKLIYEEYYVIVIGLMDGHCTVAKDIYILSNGDVDDDNARINGIQEFIQEYYDKYTKKNKTNDVYLVFGI